MSKPKATNSKKSKAAEVQPPASAVDASPTPGPEPAVNDEQSFGPGETSAPPEPTPETLPEPAPVPRARRGVAPDQTKDRMRRYYAKRGSELPKALR